MKTKDLLFGQIKMNVKMYNILYTLLCVVVLIYVVAGGSEISSRMLGGIEWSFNYAISLLIRGCILYFVGYKLLNKNNYS